VDPLLQAFFEEAAGLLSDFESGLLTLEERPGDAETLNRVFRSAHTLKGNSSMLGLDEIAHFTHTLEDLLDQLRKGRRTVTQAAVDTLLASGDILRALIARAQAGGGDPSAEEREATERVAHALRAIASGQDVTDVPRQARPPAPTSAPAVQTLYEIRFRPPGDLFRRGLDPARVVRNLAELGELLRVEPYLDEVPALSEMDPEQCYLGWTIWLLSHRPQGDVEAQFDFVAEPSAVTIEGLPMGGGDGASPAPAAETAPAEAPVPAVEAAAPAPDRIQPVKAAAPPEAASIRVPVEKVDRLINLVGELVITQSIVAQTVANFQPDQLSRLTEAVAQMDRHARELHERMMAVRMIPIKTLFGRFPRLVRDLGASSGKQVTLETAGEETELDKTVIEKIGDPLTHLIRNAVDHGVEPPEDRLMAGKPEHGTVRLEAYQQGGNIYIEVSDDGNGLDRERIVAKAVQNGLVRPDQALTDEEALGLIFRPGLSTAEKVTSVSGRGVGMDVVKRNVEALSGSISIRTEAGKGTCFTIKLPLTLAIMDGQSLRVGDQVYILPLVAIVESIRPTASTVRTVFDQGETVTVRGHVLPVIRLHALFDVEPRTRQLTEALTVIVEHEGRLAALMVDELLGQQQVVIKSLEANFKKVEGVAGATILGDGRVALILDVPGLVALARSDPRIPATA
jgi:two-component system chemotaxis sensor kinase CheA